MEQLARAAGCCVGALYARFPDKNAFLYHLIADAFRTMTNDAKLALVTGRWTRPSGAHLVRQIVTHVVSKMTCRLAAGVIRATLKLSTVKPITIELFHDYRAAVTEDAVALLSPKLRHPGSRRSVKVAMQIVFAVATDAVL